jgi:hypothetical protein
MPYFNIVAAYNDDGGIYEWQGEAADYDDALRAAQEHHDNCPTAVAEGEEPHKMFDEEQASVMDVTADVRGAQRGRRDPARHRRAARPHAPP